MLWHRARSHYFEDPKLPGANLRIRPDDPLFPAMARQAFDDVSNPERSSQEATSSHHNQQAVDQYGDINRSRQQSQSTRDSILNEDELRHEYLDQLRDLKSNRTARHPRTSDSDDVEQSKQFDNEFSRYQEPITENNAREDSNVNPPSESTSMPGRPHRVINNATAASAIITLIQL